MEACQGVERDINNVADKFSNLGESNHRILEEAIQLVRAAKDEIRDGKGNCESSFCCFPINVLFVAYERFGT